MYGEYQHSLDEKGRVNFPAKLREELGSCFMITKGLDNCLFVYSEQEWSALEQKIRALPLSKARGLQRFFFAGASEVEPDKQGRVLIPPNLREYAGLNREVVIAGLSVRAEIWDKERWLQNNAGIEMDAIIDVMDEMDI